MASAETSLAKLIFRLDIIFEIIFGVCMHRCTLTNAYVNVCILG